MRVLGSLLALCVSTLSGCGPSIILPRGPFVATPLFQDVARLSDERVEGRACKWGALVFPSIGDDSLEAAFANALDNSPEGTTGLADARISVIWPYGGGGLLLRRYCTIVKGFPARRVPESPEGSG